MSKMVVIESADGRRSAAPILPKPTRVERWQRWRDDRNEYVVQKLRGDGSVHLGGCTYCDPIALLTADHMHFLGYAKPDKVEVGQRWRGPSHDYRCIAVDNYGGGLLDRDGTQIERSAECLLTQRSWEYLGMVPPVEKATAERVRPIGGYNGQVGPKAEARSANELAAKRLIENPPDWAYPTAWRCAVLSTLEWFATHPMHGDPDLADRYNGKYSWCGGILRSVFSEKREVELNQCGEDYADLARCAIDAYACGMEKPAGLMQRPRKNDGSRSAGDVVIAKARNEMRRK